MADSDDTDLAPLAAAIGDAHVVLLGEETHGDGATFAAKARIVRYLHERRGFDVLAWESGLFDLRVVDDDIGRSVDAVVASRRGVFEIWSHAAEVTPLLQYVGAARYTNHPLRMAGFDVQLTGEASRDQLLPALEGFARHIGSRIPSEPPWSDVTALIRALTTRGLRPSTATAQRARHALAQLRAATLAFPLQDESTQFWAQMLESLNAYIASTWDSDDVNALSNARDRQMARNLIWLVNTGFPEHKVIVWAASAHIARNTAGLQGTDCSHLYGPDRWSVHLGTEVARALGASSLYSIGFIAAKGRWHWAIDRWVGERVPTPSPASIEALLDGLGSPYSFTDFRHADRTGAWLRNSTMAPFGYAPMTGDWPSVLDGVIFIRDMTPATPAQ